MNRKQFLQLLGRGALLAATTPVLEAAAGGPAPPTRAVFTARQRRQLRALADEIVPASDGMPSAGELEAVSLLEALAARHAAVRAALRDALTSLERRAPAGRAFERLPPPQRTSLLRAMETEEPDRFRAARDLVYEAYYTHPLVWRLLGYQFIGADESGPALEPFEEDLLARVRALNRIYRSVP